MMPIAQLIGRVSQAGYAILVKGGQPTLKRQRGDKQIPPALLDELKSRRDEILKWMGSADVGNDAAPDNIIVPGDKPGEMVALPMESAGWTKCKDCPHDVNPTQMKDLTFGLWMMLCGQSNCQFRPHGDCWGKQSWKR